MHSDSDEDPSEQSPMLKSQSASNSKNALQWADDLEEDEETYDGQQNMIIGPGEDEEGGDLLRERRIYGGKAALGEGQLGLGDRSVFQVSQDVALTCLSGTPLLIPFAFQATGLAVGIPLLFLISFLSWVAHVVLNVERRYVGGYNIAKAVFPSGFGGRYLGQILIDLLILSTSSVRTVLVFTFSIKLLSQSLEAMFSQTPYIDSYHWVALVLTLIYVSLIAILWIRLTPLSAPRLHSPTASRFLSQPILDLTPIFQLAIIPSLPPHSSHTDAVSRLHPLLSLLRNAFMVGYQPASL